MRSFNYEKADHHVNCEINGKHFSDSFLSSVCTWEASYVTVKFKGWVHFVTHQPVPLCTHTYTAMRKALRPQWWKCQPVKFKILLVQFWTQRFGVCLKIWQASDGSVLEWLMTVFNRERGVTPDRLWMWRSCHWSDNPALLESAQRKSWLKSGSR